MAPAKYKCIRKCYFRHKVYDVGSYEVFDSETGEYIPRHFELMGAAPLKEEEAPHKAVIRGLRAPIDPDQAVKVAAKKTVIEGKQKK
jgi:hypothetical protein